MEEVVHIRYVNMYTVQCLKFFVYTNVVRWKSTNFKFKSATPHLFSADFSLNNMDIKQRILGRLGISDLRIRIPPNKIYGSRPHVTRLGYSPLITRQLGLKVMGKKRGKQLWSVNVEWMRLEKNISMGHRCMLTASVELTAVLLNRSSCGDGLAM
jgi:hypothetical protein